MDCINKIDLIIIKKKNQMHAKGIIAMDQIYVEISKFDPKHQGFLDKSKLEVFLSKLGIFLKTQEVSEMHKYLDIENEQIKFENLLSLIRNQIPDDIMIEINEVFNGISQGAEVVSVETILSMLRPKEHPQFMLMNEDTEFAADTIKFGIKGIIGEEKKEMNRDEFTELVANIYWILPNENIEYFKMKLPLLFGLYNI